MTWDQAENLCDYALWGLAVIMAPIWVPLVVLGFCGHWIFITFWKETPHAH